MFSVEGVPSKEQECTSLRILNSMWGWSRKNTDITTGNLISFL